MMCPNCDGNGYTAEAVPLHDGLGSFEYEQCQCEYCEGTGKIKEKK